LRSTIAAGALCLWLFVNMGITGERYTDFTLSLKTSVGQHTPYIDQLSVYLEDDKICQWENLHLIYIAYQFKKADRAKALKQQLTPSPS